MGFENQIGNGRNRWGVAGEIWVGFLLPILGVDGVDAMVACEEAMKAVRKATSCFLGSLLPLAYFIQ